VDVLTTTLLVEDDDEVGVDALFAGTGLFAFDEDGGLLVAVVPQLLSTNTNRLRSGIAKTLSNLIT
jgi:hypothetical protein